jgi:hypothetical protein|tara:strand:+ start:466 stop:783 length:318 start_codon:yes stop_codon:yes gene_type:complete
MNKWKIGFWVSTTLLIISMAIGAYILVDQSVTIMYMQEGYNDTENDLKTISKIINETDLSKVEIVKKLKDHRLVEFMDFRSDTIGLERVQLIFKNGKLEQIENEW